MVSGPVPIRFIEGTGEPYVECPSCGMHILTQERVASCVCPMCSKRFGIVDTPPAAPADGELAAEAWDDMMRENRRLETELRHWKRAFVRLARNLEPSAQLDAALLVAELDEPTRNRVLEVAEALRNGMHPWER